ncbi:response regulator transcription factor [Variovorax sp. J22G21]|uniref:response regulator transcription factor n=1 Tax=Variovorax fucosicus TaxID=3053517 RepID=UPI002578DC0B|nr:MULTISPECIES: response regulator transcription factor [unclassified Variovorax]MDM0039041.1 response regulator transcription factor [Variovorax sp. J22R193]MDM0063817.1 response regulator transcription factor [Variovorax sp. J22G21]
MRIAILEDEPTQMSHFINTIERQLTVGDEPVVCVPFDQGEDLRRALRRETFDLLVLDWNVPDLDGVELLQWLRQMQEGSVPVIILSARASERDVAGALGAGADDYVAKPFRPLELAARIRRLLGRQQPAVAAPVERFGAWAFDRASSSVKVEAHDQAPGWQQVLTDSEYRLALALFRNLGRPVSRAYLVECIGQNGEGPTRALDTHIYRVRTKLGLYASHGVRLQTVYGLGYRLELVAEANPKESS